MEMCITEYLPIAFRFWKKRLLPKNQPTTSSWTAVMPSWIAVTQSPVTAKPSAASWTLSARPGITCSHAWMTAARAWPLSRASAQSSLLWRGTWPTGCRTSPTAWMAWGLSATSLTNRNNSCSSLRLVGYLIQFWSEASGIVIITGTLLPLASSQNVRATAKSWMCSTLKLEYSCQWQVTPHSYVGQ